MQEQNEQKKGKLLGLLSKKDIIFSSIFVLGMIAALVFFVHIHPEIPTTMHGESNTPYPWVHEGVAVKNVDVRWVHSSKTGNTYLKTHVGVCPYAEIELTEDCTGSGFLAVYITDGDLDPKDRSTRLSYTNGQFVPTHQDLIVAEGKVAKIYFPCVLNGTPCGMGKNENDTREFVYHATSRNRALWRLYIQNKPEGQNEYTDFGYTTIPVSGKEL